GAAGPKHEAERAPRVTKDARELLHPEALGRFRGARHQLLRRHRGSIGQKWYARRVTGPRTRHEPASSDLERGRSAYAERRWGDAYEALRRADEQEALAPDDLDLLSRAAALTGDLEAQLHHGERSYKAHLDRGDCAAAAQAAFWVGFRRMMIDVALASGWL